MLLQIGTLIAATSLVQLANGFFNTFLSLRLTLEDFGPAATGIVLSAYFVGFTIGAVSSGGVIQRVGHIRAYTAFAGLVVVATALMPLWTSALVWAACRVVIGIGCVGLFVTTESWLNAKAMPDQRGRIFSTYMVGTFVALAIGQLAVAGLTIQAAGAFQVVIALFALALVMVSTTRAEAPGLKPEAKLRYGELSRQAPISVVGCVVSGIVTSAFYALVPAWMLSNGAPQQTIALFMLVAVLGGLAFQVPVGRLSDRNDRRLVLAGLAVGYAAAVILLVAMPRSLLAVLPVAALLGGFMSTLYPVCVAHALDRMPADRVVAVSGRLILVSGFGSALGPLVGAGIMARFDIDGLLYFMAAIALALAAFAGLRMRMREAPDKVERPFEVIDPLNPAITQTPEATEADGSPRPAMA
ncbi:MFS family permease [Bosea sp. BE271]|uniref:MFS transporter n=2 Tax=Boseaceae TaxID=2831100 RepID=UPI0028556613|nr:MULTISPECIES: MFS transporter [Bosea]MDR6828929.1 MFS family permease [Bosea robiniae]MDR6895657.1 MFS family permease [Bosea sp. BE109]MDR7139053.1 MFS family permease [Bosea sp. BE168]MDR7175909.1 MFS family permease [Bosea sp. BE271]